MAEDTNGQNDVAEPYEYDHAINSCPEEYILVCRHAQLPPNCKILRETLLHIFGGDLVFFLEPQRST